MVSVDGVVSDYHKNWQEMTQVMDKLRPWQIVMDEDAISGIIPVIDRIGQYSQFFKSEQINGLINDIRSNIYRISVDGKSSSNDVVGEVPTLAELHTQSFNTFKVVARQIARIREEPVVSNTSRKNDNSILGGKTSNQICQDIYNICKNSFVWGYNLANDLINAHRQISERRKLEMAAQKEKRN